MIRERVRDLLQRVADGTVTPERALQDLTEEPMESLDFATIDHHRALRQGFPEVIYGAGKTSGQIVAIAEKIAERSGGFLATRLTDEAMAALTSRFAPVEINALGRTAWLRSAEPPPMGRGTIMIVTAGTSDLPVAEEAAMSASALGNAVTRLTDVGVAGLHRLLAKKDELYQAAVIVVIAGMDGALPSVVGGLVRVPVIAVPTSVGYGASFGGIAALLSMLNSCAAGVTVVNIDNGFGAAMAASASITHSVTWIISASAVLFVVAILAARKQRGKRRREARASLEDVAPLPDFDASESMRPEKRVQQFRMTSSIQQLEEPITDPRDLRMESQALVEEGEIAHDMATLDSFLADVRDSLGGDEAVYWRWSRGRDTLTPGAWSTPNAQRPQFFDMSAWGALVKWAAEGRVLSFDADARVAVTRLASAPVELDGRLIGVLSVARAEGLERGREHIKQWLPRHAAQVGRLVSLFEVRLQMGRHMRHSKALLRAAQLVQGHRSQESLNKAICETALQVTSATEAALVRWRGDEGQGWVQFATAGLKHKPAIPLSPDSLVARVCADATMFVHEDVAKMAGPVSVFFDNDDAWTKGALAIVPLQLGSRPIGAIIVAAPPKVPIPTEEARNIALLGALAATSLEMVWEIEEVSRRARTDALTGLANRRAFDEHLSQLLAHADRFGHPISLILVDVDHFKKVNDTWGHEAGDVVLKHIAQILQDGVRAVDICARFGGEEIALLLPQTALPGAAELADRLRQRVGDQPVMWDGTEVRVTVSCGVACYPEGVLTKEALFAAADRALYEAKSAGRNCVKSAVPKPTGVAR